VEGLSRSSAASPGLMVMKAPTSRANPGVCRAFYSRLSEAGMG
jgi:hypothetical protein